ncbi:MAG: hypothetical protein L0I79_00035 [Atopostipes sp.]|nr:hypothetical protein [Atopostipes sp.]
MTKEKERKVEKELTDLSNLEDLEMSDAYLCDAETGICGPAEAVENDEVKEKKE